MFVTIDIPQSHSRMCLDRMSKESDDAPNRVEHKTRHILPLRATGKKYGKDRGLSLRFIKGRGIVKAHKTIRRSRLWIHRLIFSLSDHLSYDAF
jgi:hypothetical protein